MPSTMNSKQSYFSLVTFFLVLLILGSTGSVGRSEAAQQSSPRICVAVLDQWKSKPEDTWRTDSTISVQGITSYFKKQNPSLVFKDLTMLSSSQMDKDEYVKLARKNRFDVLILGTTRSIPRPVSHNGPINPWAVAQDDPLLSGPRYSFAVTGEWRIINTSTSEVISTISERFISSGNEGGVDAYDFETARTWSSEQLLRKMIPDLFSQTLSWWNQSTSEEKYEVAFHGFQGQSADILEELLSKTEGIKRNSIYLIGAFEGIVEFSVLSESDSKMEFVRNLKKQLGENYQIDGIRSGKITIKRRNAPSVVTERKKSEKRALPVTITEEVAISSLPPTQLTIQPLHTYGRYYALLIGITDYQHMTPLKTALTDAEDIAILLKEQYGYDTSILKNPGRDEIINVLTQYRKKLTSEDNFLIYYAGHGWLDAETNVGYWFPADSSLDSPAKWISNATITDSIKALKAKHVIVVADSCYSGSLSRSIVPTINKKYDSPEYWQQLSKKKTRVVLTSGGNEPVSDTGSVSDLDHSVFASALLAQLKSNEKIIDGAGLYQKLRRNVVVNSNQTPEYSDLRMAGHGGGDFIFVKSGKNE